MRIHGKVISLSPDFCTLALWTCEFGKWRLLSVQQVPLEACKCHQVDPLHLQVRIRPFKYPEYCRVAANKPN